MISKQLGPSVTDLARDEGREEGLERGLEMGRKEGREEGREEGLEKGREKGQMESHRAWLINVLTGRFGSVPEAVVERIQSLPDVAQLKQAIDRAWACASIDEFQI